jgi:lysophospholipase L1-like esterase
MLNNLLLAVSAIVMSIALGEAAIRAMFNDITTTYDNRSYFALKWKRTHLRLNSMNYREQEFSQDKPEGHYRIAFIGDSFTFGQGINEEDRMSNILERLLSSQRSDVEVLNFGNPGDNTADEVRALKAKVLPKVNPDFVILQWYANDVEYKPPHSPAGENTGQKPDLLNSFKQKMLNVSATYFLLADVFHRVRDGAGMSYAEELFSRVGDENSQEAREAEKAMVEFLRACKDSKVPVGLVLIPHLSPLRGNGYPFSYLHRRVAALCDREQVMCVDLLQTFYPYLTNGRHESLWVNRFDPHMSPFANELASRRLLEVFGSVWAPDQVLISSQ